MDGASIGTIRINGGRLCLDFINTAAYPSGLPATEFVTGFDDLVRWGLRENLIGTESAEVLRQRAAKPAESTRALRAALELRSSLRQVFEPGRSEGERTAGLSALARELARVAGHLPLKALEGTGAEYAPLAPGLDAWITGPLAISGIELATSKAAAQVRMCPGDTCHWLFLDASRAGTRRWCSMESCGNRSKARAHYEAARRTSNPSRPKRLGPAASGQT